MFVLLIIDTAEKPIIEMQRVTYENGKPRLKHYLDDIPFDYLRHGTGHYGASGGVGRQFAAVVGEHQPVKDI